MPGLMVEHSVALFTLPYREGDGRAIDALREGKAVIATAWREKPRPLRAKAARSSHMMCRVVGVQPHFETTDTKVRVSFPLSVEVSESMV